VIQENNFNVDQIAAVLNSAGSLPELQQTHSILRNDIDTFESKRKNLSATIQTLEGQIDEAKKVLEYCNYEHEMKTAELSTISSQVIRKKRIIQKLDKSEEFNKIKETAKKETEFLLHNNRELLYLIVGFVLEAIRRYPAVQELIFDLLTLGMTSNYQESWVESHKIKLILLSENIQNEMAEKISKRAIDQIVAADIQNRQANVYH
jgi:hypothetical protein